MELANEQSDGMALNPISSSVCSRSLNGTLGRFSNFLVNFDYCKSQPIFHFNLGPFKLFPSSARHSLQLQDLKEWQDMVWASASVFLPGGLVGVLRTTREHLLCRPLLVCWGRRQSERSDIFLTGCLPVAWRSYAQRVSSLTSVH